MGVNTDTGEYEQDTEAEKLAALQAEARDRFDFDPEEHDDASVTQFFATYAAVAAANTEQSFEDVFDASFVDSAVGTNLERVVKRIGVQRRPPVESTGVQRFIADGTLTSQHTIPAGTTVRTRDDSVSFETDADATLGILDDMEDADPVSNYSGDTADYSASTSVAYRGSQSLFADGSGEIIHDDHTVTRGDTITCRVYLESGGGGPDRAGILYFASASDVNSADEVILHPDTTTFGFSSGAQDNSVTIPKDEWLLVEFTAYRDLTREATLYDEAGDELSTVEGDESSDNNVRWGGSIGFNGANGEAYLDDLTRTAVAVDTTAVSAGSHGNVAEDTLTVLDTTLSGVDSTTNSIPTGDNSYRDTSEVVLQAGRDEEDDDELRERTTREDEGSLGKATADAILDAVSDVESVTSLSLEQNKTSSTDGDGRPPNSFEVIVPAHANTPEVATAIYETKAHTDNDSGGHVGTEVTETVTSDVHPSYSETISFTEAPIQDVDMTLEIVVNDDYGGDDALRRRVVEYVGGTRPDGVSVVGLGLGEDVYVDELKERIMADDGIVGFDDANTSFTPSTTTDANGLTIIDVASTDIAESDGTDGSITVSTTTV